MGGVSISLLSARDQGLPPNLRLNALLYLPVGSSAGRGTAPALVVGHGAGSRATRHADFCLEASRQGFVVLAPDFRGHGDSDGVGDGPLEQDVLAAARFLHDHPAVDPRAVCYRGSSMGGFYGLKAAPQAGFAALALICPADEEVMLAALSEDDITGSRDTEDDGSRARAVTRWDRRRMRAYFEQQDSRALAALIGCPVLLVHARPDTQVPLSHSLAIAGSLPTDTTLLALEEGHHASAQHDPAVHDYVLSWLLAQIARPRESRASH